MNILPRYSKITLKNRTISKSDNNNMKKEKHLGLGIALGVAIGSLIGIALDNIALWITVGLALGAGIGSRLGSRKDKNEPL
tara:strand:+ start:64 stop:306 length:243 start_codon:yes stop_codon:yes gene_type:complete